MRLATLLRCVVTCYDMLGVVGSNLKMVKFFMQNLWISADIVVVWPGSCKNFEPGHAHLFDFQLATCHNTLPQGGQTHATCLAQQCCELLSSNVAIVWPGLANAGPIMLRFVALRCFYRWTGASNLSQQHPTCRNMSQQGGQTHATCCTQQCCDMLR